MIRLFAALCKALNRELAEISDEQLFQDATERFRHYGARCPVCGAAGKLSPYGSYSRGLTSHRAGRLIDSHIEPRRFECKSCGSTHALLPDVLTPYSPYSLRFKLLVLAAYFERATTVAKICEGFGIAVSTLYEWKKRLISHKDLLLGVLISRKTSALAFLSGLIGAADLSRILCRFFNKYGFSFMQRGRRAATQYVPP
jgi:transposase-like protein